MPKTHAEIEYQREDGTWIHSDICPRGCDFKNANSEYRKNLHDFLDEWLNNGNGTGIFYIANSGHTLGGTPHDAEVREMNKNFILIPRG